MSFIGLKFATVSSTISHAVSRSTQFVLVFFSCVILTLRAAFYEVEIEKDEEYDGKSHEGGIPKSDTIPDDESLSPRHPTARIMPNDSTGEWEMEYVQ